MSSGCLASTVCPHVGGKTDQCSATSAADCADQVTRWSCVFRAGVCRESLATSALLYLDSNAVQKNDEVVHVLSLSLNCIIWYWMLFSCGVRKLIGM